MSIYLLKKWILIILLLTILGGCSNKVPEVVNSYPSDQSNTERPDETDGLGELFDNLGVGGNKQITPDNVDNLTELSQFGKGDAYDIDLSPDGKTLAVASATGIFLYSMPDLSEVGFLPVGITRNLAFSPDGSMIVMVLRKDIPWSSPQSISVWDVKKEKQLWRKAIGNSFLTNSFYMSSDSQFLFNPFDDSFDHAWYLRTGEDVQGLISTEGEWDATGKSVWRPVVSPDFKKLAVLEEEGLRSFDLQTGNVLGTLQLDHYFLTQQVLPTYALSSDWKHVAIRQHDGKIGLWDALTGDQLWVNDCDSNTAYDVGFSPDNKLLAAIDDENICVWDVNSGTRLFTLQGEPRDDVWQFDFSTDGSTFVSLSRYQVNVWNLSDGVKIGSLDEYGFGPAIAAISPDGKLVAAGYQTGEVWLWDTTTGALLWEKKPLKPDRVKALQFSKDGLTLFVEYLSRNDFQVIDASSGEELFQWDISRESIPGFLQKSTIDFTDGEFVDIRSGRQVVDFADFEGHELLLWALSPDGLRLTTYTVSLPAEDWVAHIRVWDTKSGEEILTVAKEPMDLISLIFSPDNEILIGVNNESTVFFWNTKTGEEIQNLPQSIYGDRVTFSPDGQSFAISTYGDYTKIKSFSLWDIKSGKQICSANQGENFDLVFSSDGQIVATNSADGLRLWDKDNCELLSTGEYNIEGGSFAFSQDGRFLVTGDTSGVVKIWGIP